MSHMCAQLALAMHTDITPFGLVLTSGTCSRHLCKLFSKSVIVYRPMAHPLGIEYSARPVATVFAATIFCCLFACAQILVGSHVYVCSTGDGSILELSYPKLKLVSSRHKVHILFGRPTSLVAQRLPTVLRQAAALFLFNSG